jgi:preprotein translocase subunit SecG
MLLGLLKIIFILASILLIFIILVQPSRGEGIASAFGGVGTDTFFGTKAHQQISRFTVILSIIVLALVLLINILASKKEQPSRIPKGPPPAHSTP